MNKPIAYSLISITGLLLGFLHWAIKPRPDDKEIGEYTLNMSNATEWRGQIAPDFQLTTTRGEHFQLSDNVGKKIIVLNFFATWCAPCRAEMPELNSYFKEHKAESFLLVGIDSEEKLDRVNDFLTDLNIDFPVGIDSGPISRQYGVSAFPTTVLIGVDGKVQFYETGALVNGNVAFDNLLKQNRQLLQAGRVISPDEYRLQAQKQSALPLRQSDAKKAPEDEFKLDERGKQIAARMDCPCGCDDKVQACSCNTSKKIKKALPEEELKDKSDEVVIKALNKRFCSGGM